MTRRKGADLAAFLNARWREEEERLREGWYSDTHWNFLRTRNILGAWVVSRHNGISSDLNDRIANAGLDYLRELFDTWQRDYAQDRLADLAAKRKLLGAHREDKNGRCRTCARWTTDMTDDGHRIDRVAYEGAEGPCLTRRLLAAPYSAHEGFKPGWKIDA